MSPTMGWAWELGPARSWCFFSPCYFLNLLLYNFSTCLCFMFFYFSIRCSLSVFYYSLFYFSLCYLGCCCRGGAGAACVGRDLNAAVSLHLKAGKLDRFTEMWSYPQPTLLRQWNEIWSVVKLEIRQIFPKTQYHNRAQGSALRITKERLFSVLKRYNNPHLNLTKSFV